MQIKLLYIITHKKHQHSTDRKKLMIYLNPNAGSGTQKYFNRVINFLSNCCITFDLCKTKYKGHCKEHLNSLEPSEYHGVVIISGDGLVHEFVNSKMVDHLSLTHVPAGSANACAKNQTCLANEACEVQQALFLSVKGNIKQFNLMKCQIQNRQEPIYSFLSLQWAILADLDINSEFLRFLGGFRFDVYGLWRIIKMIRYLGKLSYSQHSQDLPFLNQPLNQQNFTTIQTNFTHIIFCCIPYISIKHHFAPLLQLDDKAIDLQMLREQYGRWQLAKYLLKSESGSHFNLEKQSIAKGFQFQHCKIKCFRLQAIGQNKGVFAIDGEHYQTTKIQSRISHKKLSLFC